MSLVIVNCTDYKDLSTSFSQCMICLKDFTSNDRVSVLKCNHIFHTKCIITWGKVKNNCPYCRKDVETYDLNNWESYVPRVDDLPSEDELFFGSETEEFEPSDIDSVSSEEDVENK